MFIAAGENRFYRRVVRMLSAAWKAHAFSLVYCDWVRGNSHGLGPGVTSQLCIAQLSSLSVSPLLDFTTHGILDTKLVFRFHSLFGKLSTSRLHFYTRSTSLAYLYLCLSSPFALLLVEDLSAALAAVATLGF